MKLLIWALLVASLIISVAMPINGVQYGDFSAFIASGRAALRGDNPYAAYPPLSYSPNLNPPITVPLFAVIAPLEPTMSYSVWRAAYLILYLAFGLVIFRHSEHRSLNRITWYIALAGFWASWQQGQIYILLFAAAVIAWLAFRSGRLVLAGVMLGFIVAIKPNFALWPLLLLVGHYWLPAAAAGFTAALLSVIPLAIYGPLIYRQWLAAAAVPYDFASVGISLMGFVSSIIGHPTAFAFCLALVLGLCILVYRHRPSILDASRMGIIAGILCAPVAWSGYILVLIPFIITVPWTRLMRYGAALSVIPNYVIAIVLLYVWRPLSWIHGLALCLMLLATCIAIVLPRGLPATSAHRQSAWHAGGSPIGHH